ncbi:MAG: LptA/OstA family protein [Rhodospirillaceae bacterium]
MMAQPIPYRRFAALPAVLLTALLAAGPYLVANAAEPAAPAAAPAPGTNAPGGGTGPVNVQADNAIEWHQDQKAYVARGNAVATRGTTIIHGDVLTAYYRETKDKGNDVYRMTAEGNVHVISPSRDIFGEHGVWDNDKQVGVVTGKNLKMVTPTDIITARDSLEYYDGAKLGVARGDAIAVRNDNRMRADTIVAQFKQAAPADGKGGKTPPPPAGKALPPPAGKAATGGTLPGESGGGMDLDRMDGIGNVLITTPTDVATCQRVMYSAPTEIAVLVGNVKITRGEDQVNGDAAEMNMKTKVNRVLSTGKRVEGLLIPRSDNQSAKPAPTPGAPTPGAPIPGTASGRK